MGIVYLFIFLVNCTSYGPTCFFLDTISGQHMFLGAIRASFQWGWFSVKVNTPILGIAYNKTPTFKELWFNSYLRVFVYPFKLLIIFISELNCGTEWLCVIFLIIFIFGAVLSEPVNSLNSSHISLKKPFHSISPVFKILH